MPRSTVLSRRAVLRGSLLGLPVGMGLPLLDGMLDGRGEALAATGDPLPRRFGTWFFGGGVVRSETFFPRTPGRDFQLTEMLQPLERVRDYLTLVRGPGMSGIPGYADTGVGGHFKHRGMALSNSYTSTAGAGYPGDCPAASLDQIVADEWRGRTRFDSLQVGVSSISSAVVHSQQSSVSWKAGNRMMKPDTDPRSVFMRLFSGQLPQPAGATDFTAIQAARRSVLDAVVESNRRLAGRVGARDRQRLDAHLEGLRGLERRLQAAPGAGRTCAQPVSPTIAGAGSSTRVDFEGINRAMTDLLVVALACDLTRVFSVYFSPAGDNNIFTQVGETEAYHPMSHNRTWYYANAKKIVTFIMKQVAYLAERLRATPEGTGNLLDQSLVYATTEFQDAFEHSINDHPFVLIGRAGGSVAGGTYLRTSAGSNAWRPIPTGAPSVGAVMMAALHAVEVKVTGVGSPDRNKELHVTQPLPGILKTT